MDVSFLTRERSFALVYWTGDVYEHLPSFLQSCGYKILGDRLLTAPFLKVVDEVEDRKLPHGGVVLKAAYQVPGGTVVLDPEMAFDAHEITGFCSVHHVEAFVAVWERFSQTTIAQHVTADGIRVDYVEQERAVIRNVGRREVLERVSSGGAKAILIEGGAQLEAVFGTVSARILTLQTRG
jgi:hypothetical protein